MSTLTKRVVSSNDNQSNKSSNDANNTQVGNNSQLSFCYIRNNEDNINFLRCSTPSLLSPKYIVTPRKSIRKSNHSANLLDPVEFVSELKRNKKSIFKTMLLWFTQILTCIQRFIISYMHYSKINIRLIIYFVLIVITGLVKEYVLNNYDGTLVSPTNIQNFVFNIFYLRSSKRSFLNVYFVKLGWFWTFLVTIPYFFVVRFLVVLKSRKQNLNNLELSKTISDKKTIKNYETIKQPTSSGGDENKQVEDKNKNGNFLIEYLNEVLPPIIRLSLATLIWYVSVQLFVYIATLTGHCESKNNTMVFLHKKINECLSEGKHWIYGFDISGHLFLMTFSNLIIIEELRYLLFKFEEFHEFYRYLTLKKFDRIRTQNFIEPYRFKMNSLIHWVGFAFTIIMFFIMTVWDYMMLQTMLFYHNLMQKILGFLWAVIFWFIIYRIMGRFQILSDLKEIQQNSNL